MNRYGQHSLTVRSTLHPELVWLFDAALAGFDHTLLRGRRTHDDQAEYVAMGWSQTMQSRHLPGGSSHKLYGTSPEYPLLSYAVDAAPWFPGKGVSYSKDDLIHFAGFVEGVASQLGIGIISGNDWDGDRDMTDQTFMDRVHFQLEARQ